MSEGEYVTMGLNESVDLANVVQFLKEKYGTDQFNLWGRSMGAVTAVLYCAQYPKNVSRMVLDSPFCNFRQLVREIVSNRTGLPEFLFGVMLTKI
jgi:pimeloyl-ACP methyl ester carboxylesterase